MFPHTCTSEYLLKILDNYCQAISLMYINNTCTCTCTMCQRAHIGLTFTQREGMVWSTVVRSDVLLTLCMYSPVCHTTLPTQRMALLHYCPRAHTASSHICMFEYIRRRKTICECSFSWRSSPKVIIASEAKYQYQ